MRKYLTIILIATGAFSTSASADIDPKNSISAPSAAPASTAANATCPAGHEIEHRQLQGIWQADIEGQPTRAKLHLGPHPELAHSVRGSVQRGHSTAQVAGDLDAGELTLEESDDGQRISATWLGTVVEGSCSREIRGAWLRAEPESSSPFVLRKQTP